MSDSTAAAEPTMGLFARFVGIIFSPGVTFASALKTPKPFGILFLSAIVIGLAGSAPQMTESGRQAMLDMQIQSVERMTGEPVTDEMYTGMESRARYGPIFAIVGTLIMMPIMSLLVTGFLWGVFNAILGGTESFKSVLTVVTHGMVIAALGAIAAAPVIVMQGVVSTTGPFNLGVLVPMLDASSFPARFLSAITVFGIWQTIVVAIGLAVLYRKSTQSIAMGLLVLYALITAVMVTIFGAFMNFGG